MAELTYLERVETESPSGGGCAIDSARFTRTWLLDEVDSGDDLQTAITEILGATEYDPGDGRLRRTPPLADPCFPWMFASSISQIRGIGNFTKEAAQEELEVPSFDFYALYDQYLLTVESTPRPYPVATDERIQLVEGSWYNDDGDLEPFWVAQEWERYTDFELLPGGGDNFLTQQVGMMQMRSSDSSVNNKIFNGSPRMFIPNQLLRFVWYGVPYRFYSSDNSYLTGGTSTRGPWFGRINQNAWLDFPAGSLLYMGAKPMRYTPPVQSEILWEPGVFSTEKLMNLELTFLYTTRQGSDLPSAPSNGNYLMAGHNLLPFFPKLKFFYASAQGTGVPSFLSFPVELLFYDPDSANTV